jgi:hypothetical protein
MAKETDRATRIAKIVSISGWAVFLALVAYSYFDPSSFSVAKAVGLTWIAYYFYRFTQPDELVADRQQATITLCLLVVLLGWSDLYSSVEQNKLLKDIEKACRGDLIHGGFKMTECDEIQSLIDSYREPESSDSD